MVVIGHLVDIPVAAVVVGVVLVETANILNCR